MLGGSGLLHSAVAAECRQYCSEPAASGICFGLTSLAGFICVFWALGCCCGAGLAGSAANAARGWLIPVAGAAEPPTRVRRGRLEGYRGD